MIKTYDNFLTETECSHFINNIHKKPLTNKHCFTNSGIFENDMYTDQWQADFFCQKLKTLDANPDFIKANKLIMTAKYTDGKQFSLHTDTGLYYNRDDRLKSRYTMLIYLNDDYEGGKTSFYTDTFKHTQDIIPKAGRCLLFDIDLWHKGCPVTNGTKYWIGCEIIGKMN